MDAHPIQLTDNGNLELSRLTVFFRPLLIIPHAIVQYAWGLVAGLAYIAAWLVGIFTGRVPDGLHRFMATFTVYSTSVSAYSLLLTNPYPPFGSDPYDVHLTVPETPDKQSRLSILFRGLIAIPALVVMYVYMIGIGITTMIGWFAGVILGRMPEGLHNFGVRTLLRMQQFAAYTSLLTNRYPQLGAIDQPGPDMPAVTGPVEPAPSVV